MPAIWPIFSRFYSRRKGFQGETSGRVVNYTSLWSHCRVTRVSINICRNAAGRKNIREVFGNYSLSGSVCGIFAQSLRPRKVFIFRGHSRFKHRKTLWPFLDEKPSGQVDKASERCRLRCCSRAADLVSDSRESRLNEIFRDGEATRFAGRVTDALHKVCTSGAGNDLTGTGQPRSLEKSPGPIQFPKVKVASKNSLPVLRFPASALFKLSAVASPDISSGLILLAWPTDVHTVTSRGNGKFCWKAGQSRKCKNRVSLHQTSRAVSKYNDESLYKSLKLTKFWAPICFKIDTFFL